MLWVLVLLVTAAKIHIEEQTLVAATKQSRQAEKAVRLAYFFVPATREF